VEYGGCGRPLTRLAEEGGVEGLDHRAARTFGELVDRFVEFAQAALVEVQDVERGGGEEHEVRLAERRAEVASSDHRRLGGGVGAVNRAPGLSGPLIV